jgi:hypothetical protein
LWRTSFLAELIPREASKPSPPYPKETPGLFRRYDFAPLSQKLTEQTKLYSALGLLILIYVHKTGLTLSPGNYLMKSIQNYVLKKQGPNRQQESETPSPPPKRAMVDAMVLGQTWKPSHSTALGLIRAALKSSS